MDFCVVLITAKSVRHVETTRCIEVAMDSTALSTTRVLSDTMKRFSRDGKGTPAVVGSDRVNMGGILDNAEET